MVKKWRIKWHKLMERYHMWQWNRYYRAKERHGKKAMNHFYKRIA